MARRILSKVAWVGRIASTIFGLAKLPMRMFTYAASTGSSEVWALMNCLCGPMTERQRRRL